jgi:dihydroorotase
MNDAFSLTQPDDWHVHLRDGAAMAAVVPDTAARFGRAIVMPNLKPPITTVDAALAYRDRILAALPDGHAFDPLMTLYLTDKTSPDEIIRARATGKIPAVKYYPAGATTNSDSGVTHFKNVYPVLEAMQANGTLLLIHGEVTDHEVDVFDREAVFIERILKTIVRDFPKLKIVLEHITTADAVQFVTEGSEHLAATITAHHLLYNRNAIFTGGLRPHYYCLPVLKREPHRQALLAAATSGNAKFFLGTDSAPHPQGSKEAACCGAGCYTAHAGIELYAEAFASIDRLDRLEGFASYHGPDFYGLPRNKQRMTIRREPWQVPGAIGFGDQPLIPLRAGETLAWRATLSS